MESVEEITNLKKCFQSSFGYFHYMGILNYNNSNKYRIILKSISIFLIEFLGLVVFADLIFKSENFDELISRAPIVLAIFVTILDIFNFRWYQKDIIA
jgi:hypothetical protein